jgi:hypothetical protein
LLGVVRIDRAQLDPERRRHRLDRAELAGSDRCRKSSKDRRSLYAGCDLFEQFEPFRADANFEAHKAGGVAARPCQTFNQTGSDRIGGERKHDRHRAGQSQQGPHR